jgi:phenylpropionate dioxygenase-like ring-hydroxylating dioxygenase large terminal subunit
MTDTSHPAATDNLSSDLAGGGEWPISWQTRSGGLGVGRYTDPDFARLEYEKLWSRVWQVAARVDEIPETGDCTTYKIGDQSILLVRVDTDTIKAYFNFCPHRGTTLGDGCGHFKDGKIICPFHGWRWDLEGNIKLLLERNEFHGGKLQDSDVAMREVHSRVYAGFVFINLAPEPESFDEFIAPLRDFFDDIVLEDMHHIWWKRVAIPCNWKVAQEAFFEAYHVSATHPQLEKVGSEVVYGDREDGPMMYRDVVYDAFENGHGQFWGGDKTPIAGHVQEPKAQADLLQEMAARMNLTAEGLGGMILKEDIELLLTLKDKDLPSDANLGAEYVKLQYEAAARQNRPMPKMSPEVLARWGGVTYLFPNILVLPQAGNAVMYRALPHPTDPNQCTFEIRSTKTYPAGVETTRATVEEVTDPNQVGLIPQQDLHNLPRIQEGLRSKGMRQTFLASNQEKLILNMHREEDRYLGS